MTTNTNNPNAVFAASRSTNTVDELTQATVLFSEYTSVDTDVTDGPPVSEFAGKVHDRAVAVTSVLAHIMEVTPNVRDWE